MDTGKCIKNMFITRRGEHPLFRSFGLDGVVDRPGTLRRADITEGIAKWYPHVTSIDIKRTDEGSYDVQTEGIGS